MNLIDKNSTAIEVAEAKIEIMKARLEIAKEFIDEKYFSYTWVLEHILGFSKGEAQWFAKGK